MHWRDRGVGRQKPLGDFERMNCVVIGFFGNLLACGFGFLLSDKRVHRGDQAGVRNQREAGSSNTCSNSRTENRADRHVYTLGVE